MPATHSKPMDADDEDLLDILVDAAMDIDGYLSESCFPWPALIFCVIRARQLQAPTETRSHNVRSKKREAAYESKG